MSDSKLRGGKNLRRKWENTIIVTFKNPRGCVGGTCFQMATGLPGEEGALLPPLPPSLCAS